MTTMGTLPAFDLPDDIFPTTRDFFACTRCYLACSECSRVPPTASKYMERGYGWASSIVCTTQGCPKRGKPYLICRICVSGLYLVEKQRKHRTTPAQLRQHSKLATHIRTYDCWVASHGRQEVGQPVATVDQVAAGQMPTETDCSIQEGPVSVQSKKRPFGVIDDSHSEDHDDEPFSFHPSSPSSSDDGKIINNDSNAGTCGPVSVEEKKTQWMETLFASREDQVIDFTRCHPNDSGGYFERQFDKNFQKAKSGGAECLVARAFHGSDNNTVHPLTALCGLQLAQLSQILTERQFMLLSRVLNFLKNPPQEVLETPYYGVRVPRNPEDARSMFTKGKGAIIPNLPIPKIETLKDPSTGENYIYVSPIDCVRDLLGHGRNVEPLFPDDSVFARSPHGQELFQSQYIRRHRSVDDQEDALSAPNVFLLPMIPWADDIDPNDVKKNRHKVHVMLLTIAIPEKSIHKSHNTYLISLGPGNGDHSIVERRLQEDLQKLAEGSDFFYAKSGTPVRCVGLVLAWLADRPAKAEITCTLSGTSPSHARFGYCGVLPSNLPSCVQCHSKRKQMLPQATLENNTGGTNNSCCSSCRDWKVEGAEYPCPDELRGLDGFDPTFKVKAITFQSLQDAARRLEENVVHGRWKTKAVCRTYLKTEGIPTSLADKIFDFAKQRAPYFAAPDKAAYLAAQVGHELQQESFYTQKFLVPPSWQQPLVDIRDWVTAIMHQIFLGVVKATFADMIKDWLKTNKKFTSFSKNANSHINLIVGSLCLVWLKLEPLSPAEGTFGRYVSENYVAYVRLAKWLYSGLSSMDSTDLEYKDPPDKEVSDYIVAELKAWLDARKIAYSSNARKAALLEAVTDAIHRNGGDPPPIVPPVRQESTRESAEELIASLVAMVARVMVKGDISAEMAADTDRHVKMFLTQVTEFERAATQPPAQQQSSRNQRQRDEPIYIRKYNFITLLEIPECQYRFGSLRNLWEGDGKGEGALPAIKDSILSLKGDWAYNSALRWYQGRSLRAVSETLINELEEEGYSDPLMDGAKCVFGIETKVGDDCSGKKAGQDPNKKNFHLYTKKNAFEYFAAGSRALSMVGLSDGCYGLVIKGSSLDSPETQPHFYQLELERDGDGNYIKTVDCHACYFGWKPSFENFTVPLGLGTRTITKHCLMLPHLVTKHRYYVIASNWEEMLESGLFGAPRAPGCCY